MTENTKYRKPFFWEAITPILFLVILLSINVAVFGDDGLSGSSQIVLLLATAVACLISMRLGMKWQDMVNGMTESISSAMSSILILLMIGSLAGTWLLSGIVPAMIYYGLQILHPSIFLVAACIICAVVSLATGSSWSTVATVGLALIGIGKALGIQEGIVAGAIISGAYFGDKMSPLSDTTNLAPAMAGTDLFTHIRYMTYTTVPSMVITLLIFLGIGIFYEPNNSGVNVEDVLVAIDKAFNINLILFIPPILVIILIVKKIPALPALLIGTLLGAVFAVIFQPKVIQAIFEMERGHSGSIAQLSQTYLNASYVAIFKSMYGEISVITDNDIVNNLLSTGGMAGMLNTIWLILVAMTFGGIMEKSGMLHLITEKIIEKVSTDGGLIASTATTCMFFNVTASDQYLAIVVPGKMYAEAYQNRNLSPENLSRTLEDSATVTSVLVPWNTCGATQSNVLGVATMTYLPFCFFNIISPFMTIFVGYIGFKLRKMKTSKA